MISHLAEGSGWRGWRAGGAGRKSFLFGKKTDVEGHWDAYRGKLLQLYVANIIILAININPHPGGGLSHLRPGVCVWGGGQNDHTS